MEKGCAKQLLARVRREGSRRSERVETRAMGRQRCFCAYDLGCDTFVFEKDVLHNPDGNASVLIVEKRKLKYGGGAGFVMTVTTGNHSVAAMPLLQGAFWDLCRLNANKRGTVMTQHILCANLVDGKLELSQREVSCAQLVEIDRWLTGAIGFSPSDVVMADRNDLTLQHYRTLGQEWRVKPLVWREKEMQVALAASRKKISTWLRYYHSSRGVHFLSYTDFHALAETATTDFAAFRAGLRELTGIFEGHATSFVRQPKLHGHHEIEFFGLSRGKAKERIIPDLEKLMEGIVLRRLTQPIAAGRMAEIDALYKSLLTHPDLADDKSKIFTETLYMHITGEVYSVVGVGATPAFDDRRTALPGATFFNGRPVFHPGVDARSRVLLSNIRFMLSRDENVEYANVYELRTGESDSDAAQPGSGRTREVVYKTSRSPVLASLVEKQLAHSSRGYGSYVLARVQAFKALGVDMPEFRLLRRRTGELSKRVDYFIRTRCDGEPLNAIPANYFQMAGEFGGAEAGEDPQVVSALAFLMGDAAAQNMAMKKYSPSSKSPLYGIGKEIYQFGYDIKAGRLMPKSVSCCSARGALCWPDISHTEQNLAALVRFYISGYARALLDFAAAHPVVETKKLAERFFAGFEYRSRALEWEFTVRREWFENFNPDLPRRYSFAAKWRFALWALERQVRRIAALRREFMDRIEHPENAEVVAPDEDVKALEDVNAANVLDALEDIKIRFVGLD